MGVPVLNTAVVAQGIARLSDFYRNKTVTPGLLKAILLSVQDLENNVFAVFSAKNLNPSTPPTGDLLERIASIVGLSRNALSDAQLWTLFKVRLLCIKSRGRSEDILGVSAAMAPSSIQEFATASILLTAWNVLAGGFDFATILTQLGTAKDAGARLTLNYSTWPDTSGSAPFFVNLRLCSRYASATNYTKLASRYGSVATAGKLVASTSVVGV